MHTMIITLLKCWQ